MDMVMKYTVETFTGAERERPAYKPEYFSGFAVRHAVVGCIAVLLTYMLCKPLVGLTRNVVGICIVSLIFLHGALLLSDIYRRIRQVPKQDP
jgi:hypothetical protein